MKKYSVNRLLSINKHMDSNRINVGGMIALHQQQVPFSERRKYVQLKKCGDISASADGALVGLCCCFCDEIFLKLDIFVSHVLEFHSGEMIGYETNCVMQSSSKESHKSHLHKFPEEIKIETDFEAMAEDDKEEDVEAERVIPNEELTIASSYLEKVNDPLEGPSYMDKRDSASIKEEDNTIDAYDITMGVKEDDVVMAVEDSTSGAESDSQDSDKDDSDTVNRHNNALSLKTHSEKLSEIAIIYKQFPCLWDLDMEENRDKSRRNEAERKLLQQINQELNIQLTPTELKMRLSLLRRIFAKEKRRRIKVEESSEPFTPTNRLYVTLEFLEHSVGPFKCKECSAVIPSHDKFRIHQAAHAGVMPFVCKICGKGMNYLGNLQIHMRRHTGEAQFLCSYCGKGFPSSFDLNLHMNSHADACNYICDICGKAFSRQKFLDRHKLKHDPQNKEYKCTVCSKAFFQNYKYQEHMNSHLNIRSCICQICGKGFFSKKTLYQHRKTHDEKKAYMCTICRKDYARAASYYSHMKAQHSLEKKDILDVGRQYQVP